MYTIPEQHNILEQAGKFLGGKMVDAVAVAAAIGVLRSGIKDPRIIGGAFSLYASVKQSGQLMGEATGKELDLYIKNTYGIDVDKFVNDNLADINSVIDKYFNNNDNFNLDKIVQTPQYNSLNTSERQGLAYQIANGDLSGILYGAYNPSNSFIPIRMSDPLVLDLNGDGIINTISMTNSKAFFDTNGDGMKTLTGWIIGEDGLPLSFIKPMKYINNSLYKANFEIT